MIFQFPEHVSIWFEISLLQIMMQQSRALWLHAVFISDAG
jgi:hypothetical protein